MYKVREKKFLSKKQKWQHGLYKFTISYIQNHPAFHREERLVNLVRRRERFVGLWTDQKQNLSLNRSCRFFLARGTTKKPNFDIVQPNIPEIQKSCFWFTGCPICKRAASSKLVEDLALDLPVSFHYHYRHYGLWQQQYFSELPPGGHVQAEVRGYNNNVLIIIIVFWSLHSCLTIFLSAFLPVQYCSSVT